MLLKEIKLIEVDGTPFTDVVQGVKGAVQAGWAEKAKPVKGLDPSLKPLVAAMVADLEHIQGMSTGDLKTALPTPQKVAIAQDGFTAMGPIIQSMSEGFIASVKQSQKLMKHLALIAKNDKLNGMRKAYNSVEDWLDAVVEAGKSGHVPTAFDDATNDTINDNQEQVVKALMDPTAAKNLSAGVVRGLNNFVDKINASDDAQGIIKKSYPVLVLRIWGFLAFCGKVAESHDLIMRLLKSLKTGKPVETPPEKPGAEKAVEKELELEPKT